MSVEPRQLPIPDELVNVYGNSPTLLLVDGGSELSSALARYFSARKWHVDVLPYTDEYAVHTLASKASPALPVNLCICAAGRKHSFPAVALLKIARMCFGARYGSASFGSCWSSTRSGFLVVSRRDGALGYQGEIPGACVISGTVDALAVEAPDLSCRAIDIAPTIEPYSAAMLVWQEAHDVDPVLRNVGRNEDRRVTISGTTTAQSEPLGGPLGANDLLLAAHSKIPHPSDGPAQAVRSLDKVGGDPAIADHAIGDHPVVPASFALGWMMQAVEHRVADSNVFGITEFEVLSGVVLDGTQPRELVCRTAVSAACGKWNASAFIVSTEANGTERKRYSVRSLRLASGRNGAPVIDDSAAKLEAVRNTKPTTAYVDGTLFHGPALQGIRRASAFEAGEMVFEACLDTRPLEGSSCRFPSSTRLYHPVIADLLLQASLVVGRVIGELPGLPLRIASAEFYRLVPAGEPFYILVDEVELSEVEVCCRARACDRNGRLYISMSGITTILSAGLEPRFIRAAAARRAAIGTPTR